MECNELMVGDWIRDSHQFPMKVMSVGEGYIHAEFDGDLREFLDKDLYDYEDCKPYGIPITEEILKKNNIEWEFYDCYHFEFKHEGIVITLSGYPYIHELQHALRFVGLKEVANNFKL